MTKIEISEIIHEAIGALNRSFGDYTQLPWDEAEEWQRDCTLKVVQLHIDTPDMPASATHEVWCKDKRDHGWVHGEVKDPKLKTHPCLVDYEELPVHQRAKDRVFSSLVKSLAVHLKT